ncbi:hypothetical protein NC653_013956 [Populus alba x Populus x berolinensis]|uniref:Uncharacterized protein n=1 Tax=Populus alba x Populus x berolinensis TaxID=444605 RepID=A0AAD6QVV0_9ROSI|nr:hypothetical protein NC653_013956 [Populus alba x Populus x berolinensis]
MKQISSNLLEASNSCFAPIFPRRFALISPLISVLSTSDLHNSLKIFRVATELDWKRDAFAFSV